ncbi:cupredoxin domain-containing protein [Candidatus Collierbacteria bacterium]|nr:cupredoxin domain-containing protein [Candidatus Collierbacteria bacterium]
MEETENAVQTENEVGQTAPVKKSNNLFYIGLLIVLVIIGLPLLQNGKKKTVAPVAESVATPTPTATPVDVVNGAIAVEAGSFYYKPNLIHVKKGVKVKLTLNAVSLMHDFNIDELGIKVPVTKSGSSSTVEFTADKVGEFEFYCSIGQHRANGQVGKLIVTE